MAEALLQDVELRQITNPATGELLEELPDTPLDEVDAAVDRAVGAQRRWARVPRHERAVLMHRYAGLARQHADELAELLSREHGKPLRQSLDEVELHCRLFEGFAHRILAFEERAVFLDSQRNLERDLQVTRHEPLGVVAGIIPFNFPIELYAHKVAPSIATGNAVVIKPSEETPLATRRAVELLHQTGVPEDVVQVVYGGGAVGKRLVSAPQVAAISFTGSTEAGIDVATTAARTLKSVLLELGGNDAMIVLPDADLDLVIEQAVFGRTLSNGQCCCANKRLIVDRSIHDDVVDRLVDRFGGLAVGDPLAPTTQLGPLIKSGAAATVEEQVRHTIAQGATLAAGGDRDECFVRPTLLTDVRPEMDIAQDMEVFGPVIAVTEAASVNEAVGIANATRYGLSGSVFTRDINRAMEVATRLETGQVVINGTGLYRSDVMAFGGYKSSGLGREGLGVSLEEYLQTKTITMRGVVPGVESD
ncbi:aldehyde dehydrogenase family protein [Geodermatophilus sp. SYSU D01186]